MAWYLFEPEKKYPFAAQESEVGIRVPLALLLLGSGIVAFAAFLVSLFFQSSLVTFSSLGAFAVCMALYFAVMPSGSTRR